MDYVSEVGECECGMDFVVECDFGFFFNSSIILVDVFELGECECGMDFVVECRVLGFKTQVEDGWCSD